MPNDSRRPEARRWDGIAVAALVAVACLFFADVVLAWRGFYFLDVATYHFPLKRVVREALQSGEFPYWTRYFSGGQPLAANPAYLLFYPPQWLVLLPDLAYAFQLQILLHIGIAQIGMYAMLRSIGLRRRSSFFGGLSFGLGAFFLSLTDVVSILYATSWMPLVLMFARKLFREPSRKTFALTALFFALPLMVGEPVSILQTGMALAGLAIYCSLVPHGFEPRRLARNAILLALVAGASLSVAAVQVLPAYVHGTQSIRAFPFPWSEATGWSFPPQRLVELAFPRFFGDALQRHAGYWGQIFYFEGRPPYIRCLYVGMLPLILAVAGFTARRTRVAFSIGVVAPLLLAFGSLSPLYRLGYELGFFNRLRFPEKFVILPVFTLIVAAAVGFDRLVAGDSAARRAARIAAGVIAICVGFGLVLTSLPQAAEWIASRWASHAAMIPATIDDMRQGWVFAAAAVGIAGLLLFSVNRMGERNWSAAAILFTMIDLAAVSPYAAPRITMRYYDEPQIAREIASAQRPTRVFAQEFWDRPREMDMYFAAGLDDLPYWSYRNSVIPLLPAAWGLESALDRDIDKTTLLPTAELTVAMETVRAQGRKDWAPIFMSMSNANLRLVYRNFPAETRRIESVEDIHPVDAIAEGPYPRYYVASSLKPVNGLNDFIRQVGSAPFEPKVAYVAIPPFVPAAGAVVRADETQNSAKLIVEAAARSFLVASVTYDRNWTARIDGRETPIVRTNVAYQGIVIPTGRHTVELRYRNPLFVPAGAVSIIAIVTMLAMILSRHARKTEST